MFEVHYLSGEEGGYVGPRFASLDSFRDGKFLVSQSRCFCSVAKTV